MRGRYFAVLIAFAMKFYASHRADLVNELPANVITLLDDVLAVLNVIAQINPPGPL